MTLRSPGGTHRQDPSTSPPRSDDRPARSDDSGLRSDDPGARPDDRVVCVLGMHRSGTSCLTGSLQLAGLELGEHSTWNPHNRRGNRENPEIIRFHDDVLASNGGSWHEPPERVEWEERHVEWAERIVATYPDDRRWGFKDPKTLPSLAGWQDLLGDMCYVGIFRDPVLVARSLWRRDLLPFEKAVDLWVHYNTLLLEQWERTPFPLLDFDWDEETFHLALNRVLPEIGLDPLPPDSRFFTPDLRHSAGSVNGDRPALPEAAEELHRELRERAVTPPRAG